MSRRYDKQDLRLQYDTEKFTPLKFLKFFKDWKFKAKFYTCVCHYLAFISTSNCKVSFS